MKNLKIKFGLFSLLAVLAVSVFLTSCEQEVVAPDQAVDTEILETESKTYMIEVPDGLTGEAAVEWARQQPIEQYKEISDGENLTILESRWCYTYHYEGGFNGETCICQTEPYKGEPYCFNWCNTAYTVYCGGWSGGQYRVISTDYYSDCYC